MLDLKAIRPDPAPVRGALARRGDGSEERLDRALSLDAMRRDRVGVNGVNERLIVETIQWAQANGVDEVSLNFAGDGSGGDIVILSGVASVEPDDAPAHKLGDFVSKYAWGFERLRITPEQFAAKYSMPVRIRLTKVRGHK